ncbi:MAG: gamma-glutamylcyclotransferase family protein [Pseudomonadota bacterium]
MTTTDWCDNDSLFVFGSLMDPDVLALVSGMALSDLTLATASVQGYRQGEVEEESYPVLVACESAQTSGLLIKGLSDTALARILFFEGEEYRLQKIEATLDNGEAVAAFYFCDTGAYTVRDAMWDFDQWQQIHKPSFIEASRQYMALFGSMSAAEADAHWTALTQQGDVFTATEKVAV